MHFEVGKYYRTRDGRKARCIATDGAPSHPFLFVISGDGDFGVASSGRAISDLTVCDLDILGPWIERPVFKREWYPAWARWIALNSYGEWGWYSGRPDKYASAFAAANYLCGVIPLEFAPTYSGPWEDSLTELEEVKP